MGREERLPSSILLAVVEKVAGCARESSVWPASASRWGIGSRSARPSIGAHS